MASNGPSQDDAAADSVAAKLELLSAVATGQSHTQRSLAARLGVALGLTNALVKRAVRKGLIKVKAAPARRYAYYLTPEGFQEKVHLVSEYLNVSLGFFRRSRDQYEDAFNYCNQRGWTRVVLIGAGELAEIASIAAHSRDFSPVGIVDEQRNENRFCGLAVFRSLSEAGEVDAVVVTDAESPQQTFDLLAGKLDNERILTPAILHVSRPAASEREGEI